MNDDIFSEIKDQLRPDPDVRARLFEALDAEDAAPAPIKPRRRRRWTWAVAAAALVVGLAVFPTLVPQNRDAYAPPVLEPSASRVSIDPADYEVAHAAIQQAFKTYPSGGHVYSAGMELASGTQGLSWAQSDTAVAEGSWGTNNQVVGIDEGDVVKSDGTTIFVVSDNEVVLVAADGAATAETARIDTTALEAEPTEGTVQGPVIDLLLHDTTLVALVTEYTPRLSSLPTSTSVAYVPYDASQTKALFYDVTDPSSPRFVTSLGQSGAYVTSRLSDGLLHLVTTHEVADRDSVDADEPATFIPSVTDGRDATVLPAVDLTIPAVPTGPAFQVVSSIDVPRAERLDTASVMGRADITYMSEESLFLASTGYLSTAMSEFDLDQDSGLLAVAQATDLIRIDLIDGAVNVAGEASIPGRPLNQFALDHFDGHLRVAVTMDGTTDSGSWATYPTLLVLDDSLDVVASIPQLAVNEQIHSVRFMGDRAYVVTFQQIDPLFTLDLSIPTEPKIMSELKIPGFSTYLHPWDDGLLLGLGMDVTEQGQTLGMKLSMFDTSDPFDVTEQAVQEVPFQQAEALYNHKAVFVDAERDLIGFAVGGFNGMSVTASDYLLYQYEETTGFTLFGKLAVPESSNSQMEAVRALTIDSSLYVVTSAGVDVYDADSLATVSSQDF